jgi:hypothetical protein
MENIINIIIKIAAVLLSAGAAYLGKLLISWIKSKMNDMQAQQFDLLVSELVAAAEQMYKADDADGTVRYGYVIDRLEDLGYAITRELRDLIESKVFEINVLTRGGEVNGSN